MQDRIVDQLVAGFLKTRHPCSYCDGCVATQLLLSADAVAASAARLVRAGGFRHAERLCCECRIQKDVTERASPRRRRSRGNRPKPS